MVALKVAKIIVQVHALKAHTACVLDLCLNRNKTIFPADLHAVLLFQAVMPNPTHEVNVVDINRLVQHVYKGIFDIDKNRQNRPDIVRAFRMLKMRSRNGKHSPTSVQAQICTSKNARSACEQDGA